MDRLDLRLCPCALVDRFGRRVTCPRLPVSGRAARSGHQDMSAALGGETQIQPPGIG